MVRLLIILIFITFFLRLQAQQISFRNYSMQDGLVANPVRHIFQDAKGFIWIATWQGLSKYDGHQFTNFSTANGLSFDLVNDMCEPESGKLFVALNNGAIDMIENDRVTQRIIHGKAAVNRFFKTTGGTIYAATDKEGLFRLNERNLHRLTGPFNGGMQAYVELNDSMRIIGGIDSISLCIIDRQSNMIAVLRKPSYEVHNIYRDSQHRVWVCTYEGLLLIAPGQQRNSFVKLLPLPGHFNIPALAATVTDILEDDDGNYWIGTMKGLVKIHSNGRSQLFTRMDGLPSNAIKCIYLDKERNIWVGTEQGVSKIVRKNDIQLFTVGDGLRDNALSALYPVGDELYFTTLSGVVQKMNVKDYSLATVTQKREQPFMNLFVEQQGRLFFSTGHTLVALDTAKHKAGSIRITPGMHFFCAIADTAGNLFFGTGTGIYIRSAGTHIVRPFGGVVDRITSLAIDRQGNLWAGTWQSGLYRIKLSYKGREAIDTTENRSRLVHDSCIRYLFVDSKGSIWAGTRYNGAVCISGKGDDHFNSLHFSVKQGLTSNFVFRIVEDRKGNIWLASYLGGLDKLLPTGSHYRVFNFSRVNNFFEVVYDIYPAPGSVFWCATTSGLVRFRDDETDQLPAPKVFITRLHAGKAGNRVTMTDMRQTLSLAHHRNLIQFEFSAPSFVNEKEILYSHRLKGNGDTTWSNPASQHTVFYDALQPGRYTFEVKALGWNGGWSEPATYTFTIYPPWWQTAWFRAAVVLAMTLLITFLFRKRVRGIRRETQIQQRIIETEMMALRAQMNPHFIFNCINSIDALIQSNDKYHATVYLNKFAKLLRNILDSSKQNTVTLARDLETLQLYIDLEQLRYENKFTAVIHADKSLLQDDYKVPPLIVQPYVENAILHGLKNRTDNNGKLSITISRQPEYIEYVIEDNGVGREALKNKTAKHNSSYGMQMSWDRVKFFNHEDNASVVVTDMKKNGEAAGTKVQVLLKIQ